MPTGYPIGKRRKNVRWRLPYGLWVCSDGREVLFDRAYRPCVERQSTGEAKLADPNEWVEHRISQEHFYTDATPEKQKMAVAKAKLAEWGILEAALRHAEEEVRLTGDQPYPRTAHA
jgi:hypothetical protein